MAEWLKVVIDTDAACPIGDNVVWFDMGSVARIRAYESYYEGQCLEVGMKDGSLYQFSPVRSAVIEPANPDDDSQQCFASRSCGCGANNPKIGD